MNILKLTKQCVVTLGILAICLLSSSKIKAAESVNYYGEVKKQILVTGDYDDYYDVNNDGVINVLDAIRISQNECQGELKKEITDIKSDLSELNDLIYAVNSTASKSSIYTNKGTSTLGGNERWGFYFKEDISLLGINPEFTINTGTYTIERYTTNDNSNLIDGKDLKLVSSRICSVGESILVSDIKKSEFFVVIPPEGSVIAYTNESDKINFQKIKLAYSLDNIINGISAFDNDNISFSGQFTTFSEYTESQRFDGYCYNGSYTDDEIDITSKSSKMGFYLRTVNDTSLSDFPDGLEAGVYWISKLVGDGTLGIYTYYKPNGEIVCVGDGQNWSRLSINRLNGKKLALIGDSLTEKNNTANINWTDYLRINDGAIIQNLGASGTGFVKYYEDMSSYHGRISIIDLDTDIIGVSGSFNDIALNINFPIGTASDTTPETAGGRMNIFFDSLLESFPNTPVVCYTFNPWADGDENYYTSSSYRSRVNDYVNVLSEICANRSIPFMDITHGSNLKPWLSAQKSEYFTENGRSDGIHPNSKGHKMLYDKVRHLFEDNVF